MHVKMHVLQANEKRSRGELEQNWAPHNAHTLVRNLHWQMNKDTWDRTVDGWNSL